MIAAWMAYCGVLGALVAVAALVVEHLVDQRGGATRRVWAWGMTAAIAVPLTGVVLRDGAPVDQLGVRTASDPVGRVVMHGVDLLAAVDGALLFVWVAASVLSLVAIASAVVRTRRRRQGWRSTLVDGVPVLISRDVGPAVVGLLRGTIVLPDWALRASPSERTMMLRHEQEHVRAGDPLLAMLGVALVATMPWSPALWYMAHRLRLAIEVDCDRRVVGSGGVDVRAYGSLLLAVGRRRSSLPLAAAAFSRPRSALEHRIDRMTVVPVRAPRWKSVLLGVTVVGLVVGVWALPQPVRAADVNGEVIPCPQKHSGPPVLRWR